MYMKINEFTIFAFLIYYYINVYITKIYSFILKNIENNKIYDHIIYDILFMKQLFLNSMGNLKIIEYLTVSLFLSNTHLKNEDIIKYSKNIVYDYTIENNEIKILEYNEPLNDLTTVFSYIKLKHNV